MSDVTDPRVAELEAEVERLRGEVMLCVDAMTLNEGEISERIATAEMYAGIAHEQRDAARAEVAALREGIDGLCDEFGIAFPGFVRRLRALLTATPSETVRPAHCPTCGSPDGFWLRAPCAADQFDPDPWHRTRPTPTDPKEA